MRYSLPLLLLLNFALSADLVKICGREGELLYTLDVPSTWEPLETDLEKIKDTKEPLLTWQKGKLKARLHSFPFHAESGSIPPNAQISRWLKRLPGSPLYEILPVSHGGYYGLILWAEALNEGFFGAAFSLGERGKRGFRNHPEFASDWTFVVTGPKEELSSEKFSLFSWVETLQLVLEIPNAD